MLEKRILILYPKEFKALSKFKRKVNHILSKISDFQIIYFNDYNDFIIHCFSNFEKIEGKKYKKKCSAQQWR